MSEAIKDTPLKRFERRTQAVSYLLGKPLKVTNKIRRILMVQPAIISEPEVIEPVVCIVSGISDSRFL